MKISGDMQNLVTYWNPTGTSTIRSLSDLGVTFNNTGQLELRFQHIHVLSDNPDLRCLQVPGVRLGTGFAALASNFTQLS